jgi:hypothetical protein
MSSMCHAGLSCYSEQLSIARHPHKAAEIARGHHDSQNKLIDHFQLSPIAVCSQGKHRCTS